jgi:uncharacterized protein (DUF1778 family)
MATLAERKTARSTARLEVRLEQRSKKTIEDAAALSGQSISDFVVSTILTHATEILERDRQIVLSNRDQERFLAALEAEEEPNAALRKAVQRFNRRTRSVR